MVGGRRGMWDAFALATSLGLTTAVIMAAGIWAGGLLDARLHTQPLFQVVGFFIGVAAGVWAFVRWVRRIGREEP